MSGTIATARGFLDGPQLSQACASVAVILAAGVGEAALGYSVFAHPFGATTILAIHVASVGLAACALWFLRRRGDDCRLSVFAVFAMAAAGPLGAIAALLTFALHGLLRLRLRNVECRYDQLFPDLPETRAEALAREVAEGRLPVKPPDGVVPFVDVMALGSFEQKQAAITRISARFRPEFAGALWRALSDPEPALRVQAATVTSRIEKDFDRRAVELERRLSSGDSTVRRDLARHLERMADSGLIDDHRSRAFRERALALWRSCEADTRNDETDEAIVRGLLSLGRADEACAWFERPDRDPTATMATRLAVLRFESLFQTRRYAELRSLCARLGAAAVGRDADIHQAVELWGART